MKIQNNYNSPIFNGYKNVLASDFSSPASNFYVVSMQLDNKGNKDLDRWKEIKKSLNIENPEGDIIHFNYIKDKNSGYEAYVVDNIDLPLITQLREGLVSAEDERKYIKLFDFMGSLTRRIFNDSLFERNRQIAEVALHSRNVFLRLFKNEEMAVDAMDVLCQSEIKQQVVAGKINRRIQNSMKKLFA